MKSIDWQKQKAKTLAEQRRQNKGISKLMLGKKFKMGIKAVPINIRPIKEIE